MARYHAEINMSSKIMMISEDLGGLEEVFYVFCAFQFLPSAPLRAVTAVQVGHTAGGRTDYPRSQGAGRPSH